MVAFHWKGAAVLLSLVCVGLTGAGLVYSQQATSGPSKAGIDPSNLVFLEEPGKPKMECQVLKTYRRPDGQLALDVKVLATGQTMTVIDTSSPPQTKSGLSNLLPWNKSKTPTAPTEYIEERAVTETGPYSAYPAGKTSTASAMGTPGPLPGNEEYRTVQEPGKPAQKCLVIANWRTADGKMASQCKVVDTGEMLTIVEAGPIQAVPGTSMKTMTSSIFHWGRSTTPPPGAPVPMETAPLAQNDPWPTGSSYKSPPVMVAGPGYETTTNDPPTPSFGGRIKDWFSNVFSTHPPTQVATDKTADLPRPVAQASDKQFDPAKLPQVVKDDAPYGSDWHQQWPAVDPIAQPLGKPAVDTTLAPNVKPSSPALAAAQLSPDAPSSSAAKTSVPPTTAQLAAGLALGSSPALPAPAPTPNVSVTSSTLPKAQQSLPLSKMDAVSSNDPLSNPMTFPKTPAIDKSAVMTPMDLPGLAAGGSKVPLGAGSVVAAANGGNPTYLPVPVVTMPPTAPPAPPMPRMATPPQAPAKAPDPAMYVNAFTVPPSPEEVARAAAMQQMAQQRPMMPPGYPGMPYGGPPMMPMPPGYGYMPPLPYDMGPGRGTVPVNYQGPAPPNPTANAGQLPMAPGYLMPMAPGYAPAPQMPYANPAMDRPGVHLGPPALPASIQTLQSSLFPAQREEAANNLATYDWRTNPQIVTLLASAAREDPAATVRSACVAALARMGATVEPVIQTLNQLKNDADPRVRQEAERALTRLAPAASGDQQAVQPASVRQ